MNSRRSIQLVFGANVTWQGCDVNSSVKELSANDTYWTFNGEEINQSRAAPFFIQQFDDGYNIRMQSLPLVHVTLHDAGFYRCVVFIDGVMSNPVVSASAEVRVSGGHTLFIYSKRRISQG